MSPVNKEENLNADDTNILSVPNNVNINIESDSDSWISDASSFDDLTDDVYDGYEMIPQTEYNGGYHVETEGEEEFKAEDFIIEENNIVDDIVKAILDSDLAKQSSSLFHTDHCNDQVPTDTDNIDNHTLYKEPTSTNSIIEDFADFDNTPIELYDNGPKNTTEWGNDIEIKEEVISAAMKGFHLPSDNIPSWSSTIPEEQWKSKLLLKAKNLL